MAYTSSTQGSSSSGGGSGTFGWQRDYLTLVASAAQSEISLTQQPVSDASMFVWSQGQWLHPADFAYNAGLNILTIFVNVTLPDDNPGTGTWDFFVQYQFQLI